MGEGARLAVARRPKPKTNRGVFSRSSNGLLAQWLVAKKGGHRAKDDAKKRVVKNTPPQKKRVYPPLVFFERKVNEFKDQGISHSRIDRWGYLGRRDAFMEASMSHTIAIGNDEFEARIHHNSDWSGKVEVHYCYRGLSKDGSWNTAILPGEIFREVARRILEDEFMPQFFGAALGYAFSKKVEP